MYNSNYLKGYQFLLKKESFLSDLHHLFVIFLNLETFLIFLILICKIL